MMTAEREQSQGESLKLIIENEKPDNILRRKAEYVQADIEYDATTQDIL